MKLMTHVVPAALMTLAIAMTPASLWAEDIEVYYSEVLSDDSVNKNVANVMIMLDTSGSMRNCAPDGSGANANWCTGNNWRDRRINLLHDAMEVILNDADENVKIGLGRFNSDTSRGASAGYIMLPVMPVNDQTKEYFFNALNDINPARTIRSPGNVMPSRLSTPTALAYEEMANYMLGNPRGPSYGSDGGQFCIVDELEEQCTTQYEYSEGAPVDFCDESSPGCSVTRGSWQSLPVDQSCDESESDVCRFFFSEDQSGDCPNDAVRCIDGGSYEYQRTGLWSWGWVWVATHNLGIYQQRSVQYAQAEVINETEFCEMVKTGDCAESVSIASGSNYVSPVVQANQCESNHIILFTDGEPTSDDPGDVDLVSCSSRSSSYACQVKIAEHLNSESNAVNRAIKTHNIGLYMGGSTLTNMTNVSSAGGGQTYNSDNAESLLLAFRQTLDLIADEANTMVAPGVAISQSQRFQHLDEMYFSLFKPLQNSYWQGNLKRYQVVVDSDEGDSHGQAVFKDVNGADAMEGDSFSANARSWWSASTDGADIVKGGARDRLQTTSRRLFYSPSPGGSLRRFDLDDFTNAELLLPEAATDAVRENVANELLNMWGDPLHSRPVMVNYGGSWSGDDFIEDNVVFVSTNAGMLHAIDTRNGDEKFAFMPHELISQAAVYTTNRLPLATGNKRQTYGLDSTWAVWRQSGATIEEAPTKVMIYGGMRRGGNQYYALNVTNVSSPSLAWQISGGTGDFKDLGQTWSVPKVARFPDGEGGKVPVVIFGGGYSPEDHDDHQPRQSQDAKGNAIYVVNANTGQLIWSAGGRSGNVSTHVPTMTHAIPGSVAVVDLDSDGVVDHLYYADLGGQLFRADIDSSEDKAHKVTRLAALGGSGANHRRFYEQPTVAMVRDGASSSLFVTLASGYRAHPLDVATQEGIFVLRDQQPFGGAAKSVATLTDFSNVAGGNLPDYAKRGWYYMLNQSEGEKALSSPTVFSYEVLFTTYSPSVQSDVERDPCSVNYGQSYLHRVDLRTGQGTRYGLDQPGLPPGVTVFLGEDGKTAIIVGTEAITEAKGGEGFGAGGAAPRDLRSGRWMQLTPDDAGAIKLPADEDDDEQGD